MSDVFHVQDKNDVTRRKFIETTSATVAAGALAGSIGVAHAAHPGGSDVLRIGVIGCGGRGKSAAVDAIQAGGQNVKIVAMGDAFRNQVDICYRHITRHAPEGLDVPEDRKFVGLDAYKNVIESDCDLVIHATPPGFRPTHLEAAIDAGKHVFVEKPLAVDAPGVRRLLAVGEAAKKKGLAIGVGLQRRHDPKYIEAIDQIHGGALGDVLLSRVYWNGSGVWVRTRADFAQSYGRKPNELEYQVNNWYYFNWLCGDHIVEQHIHNLDVSNWVRQMHPVSANGMGGRERRTGRDHGQIYDHHSVEFTYPDGTTMLSQCRHQDGCWSAVHEDFVGTQGRATLDDNKECFIETGSDKKVFKGVSTSPYVQEHIDLQASIRSGNPINEMEYGANSTMTAILGRLATYSGKVIQWDDAINSDIALAPSEPSSWDDPPPVVPDENGLYPLPVPGRTQVV